MPENAFLLLLCQTACASARKKPRNTWFQGFFREYDHIGMSVMYGWPDLEAHSVGKSVAAGPGAAAAALACIACAVTARTARIQAAL